MLAIGDLTFVDKRDWVGDESNESGPRKSRPRPLRGIAGYANELERKHRAGLNDRALFCLTQIHTATSHLDKLIDDLLHYSRLDAETPSLTEVNLRNLIGGILRDRNLVINEQHMEVTVDIPFTTLPIWERGLGQVLAGLAGLKPKTSTA